METKKKKGKIIGITIGAILFTGYFVGLLVWNHLKLDQPIYYQYLVQHYLPYEADSLAETANMQLIYVKNRTDDRNIIDIRFVDHPELKVTPHGSYENTYGIYEVVNETIYMEWNAELLSESHEYSEVNTIKVTYSDESTQFIDIGKICIYGGARDRSVLEAVDCIPLYESKREQTFQANIDLRMEGLSELSKAMLNTTEIIDSYSLKVDDVDITDMMCSIKEGQTVVFDMKLNGFTAMDLKEKDCEYDYIQIVPELIYESKYHDRFTQDIYSYPIWRYFESYSDIRKYIENRY